MGNLDNAAAFWCKIKEYITLFFIICSIVLVVLGVAGMTTEKPESPEYKQSKSRLVFGTIFGIMLTLWYFFLRTKIGCGFSIASNIYGFVR
jgi:quinol-cytochrome oxidoreductase complex cytochrome b subunit